MKDAKAHEKVMAWERDQMERRLIDEVDNLTRLPNERDSGETEYKSIADVRSLDTDVLDYKEMPLYPADLMFP